MSLDLSTQASYLLRLVVALSLSATLGWERERANRPAGLRTHMTVGMSAALYVILGDVLVTRYADFQHTRTDPIRVLQAVVAGISFLGAGTIFVMRGGDRVRGLTTAASLLATAAIGVAAGVEAYALAVGSTMLLLTVLALVNRLPGIKKTEARPASSSASGDPLEQGPERERRNPGAGGPSLGP